jgi:hypothetical protein
MFRKDKTSLGILLGFLAPVLGLIIYYYISFYRHQVSFSQFLGYLRQYTRLLTAVSSISLMANAILFTFYVYAGNDKTLKGIFISTVIYAVAVLLIKALG